MQDVCNINFLISYNGTKTGVDLAEVRKCVKLNGVKTRRRSSDLYRINVLVGYFPIAKTASPTTILKAGLRKFSLPDRWGLISWVGGECAHQTSPHFSSRSVLICSTYVSCFSNFTIT